MPPSQGYFQLDQGAQISCSGNGMPNQILCRTKFPATIPESNIVKQPGRSEEGNAIGKRKKSKTLAEVEYYRPYRCTTRSQPIYGCVNSAP